jgi:hypothetical protein
MPASPMGLGQLWGFSMKKYSIVRIGSEYVVQAGETSILKVSSRREADKLVTDAAELLQQEPAPVADESYQSGVKRPKFLDGRARFP